MPPTSTQRTALHKVRIFLMNLRPAQAMKMPCAFTAEARSSIKAKWRTWLSSPQGINARPSATMASPALAPTNGWLADNHHLEEVAKDAPDLGIPGGPILFAEPCDKESVPCTDEKFAAFRVKSTVYEVKYKKKAVRKKNTVGNEVPAELSKNQFRAQYWENLVFAVAAECLELKRCQLTFVDHDINCCQPSLRLPAEKTSRGGMRMNCHKGGYLSGNDAKEALTESQSVLGMLPSAQDQPQQPAVDGADPQHA